MFKKQTICLEIHEFFIYDVYPAGQLERPYRQEAKHNFAKLNISLVFVWFFFFF